MLRSAVCALLLTGLAACAHAPPHGGHYSRDNAGGKVQWTYPETSDWGGECVKASPPQQSPIDLTPYTEPWTRSTVVTQATFDVHDQNVVFMPKKGPSVVMNPAIDEARELVYTVAGFHFHYRNEHLVRGNPVLEMHIKTNDPTGGTAVFGVLWSIGSVDEDPTLDAVAKSLSSPPQSVEAVDVGRLLYRFGKEPFYSYVGSLTTPPCTTGIRWFVLQKPIVTTQTTLDTVRRQLVTHRMPSNNVRGLRPVPSPPPKIYLVTPQ